MQASCMQEQPAAACRGLQQVGGSRLLVQAAIYK